MHPTVRIFAVFLFAIALASAALYAIDRASAPAGGKPPAGQAKTGNSVKPAALATAPAALAPAIASSPLPPMTATPTAEAGNSITKCNVDGKIVYTDKGCPQGSKAKPLQITDNAVIPGYDRATVEKTFRQPPPVLAQAAPAGGVIEPVTSIGTEPTVDCPALGRRLNWLNGMLHRRQLHYVNDRMLRERDDLQTKMFWGHC
jgi:hypothetical protein